MKTALKRVLFLVFPLAFGISGCAPEVEAPEGAEGAAPPQIVVLPEGAEAMSLLGEPLYPPDLEADVLSRREEQLADALEDLEADPNGADAIIWAGRRYAYLGRYREAISLFSAGIAAHPGDARFYRHRGHRYITVRDFDSAIEDFRRATELIEGTEDEVEPDGQPNALGIPTSTLHFNIFYHYGLAHFVKGDFEEAEAIYRRCMEASVHPDSKAATAHWLYMTLRRLGKDEEAQALLDGMDLDALAPDVIESGAYLELLRLYKGASVELAGGEDTPETMENAARAYGIGAFHLYNGRAEEAERVFEAIIGARDQWPAFGYIAAEADLARLRVE